jgi:hypothetical protein
MPHNGEEELDRADQRWEYSIHGHLLPTTCYNSTMRFLPFRLSAASRLSAVIHLRSART